MLSWSGAPPVLAQGALPPPAGQLEPGEPLWDWSLAPSPGCPHGCRVPDLARTFSAGPDATGMSSMQTAPSSSLETPGTCLRDTEPTQPLPGLLGAAGGSGGLPGLGQIPGERKGAFPLLSRTGLLPKGARAFLSAWLSVDAVAHPTFILG